MFHIFYKTMKRIKNIVFALVVNSDYLQSEKNLLNNGRLQSKETRYLKAQTCI